MTLTRRALLGGGLLGGLGALMPRLARADASVDKLLVYFTEGGWDTTYVFDPHFDSSSLSRDPESTSAEVAGIHFADAESRPSVRSFLERHGARTAFVNGVTVSSISHAQCTRLMFTGSPDLSSPDFATWVAARTSPRPLSRLVLSGPRFPGFLGSYTVPLNRVFASTLEGQLPADVAYDPEREALLREYLAAASASRAQLTEDARYAEFAQALENIGHLRPEVAGLAIGEDPEEADELACAVHALERGLASVVTVQGQLPSIVKWDSHSDNQFHQPRAYEHTFASLDSLMSLLDATTGPDGQALSQTTMVVVLTEMGRTPALNGNEGKDHWPVTSVVLMGAGVAGGQVVGATDELLGSTPVDSTTGEASASGHTLTAAGLFAGLLSAFDVDPEEAFPGVPAFTAPFSR